MSKVNSESRTDTALRMQQNENMHVPTGLLNNKVFTKEISSKSCKATL